MSAVFLGNFDFEHELAAKSYRRTTQMDRLNAELSCHLAALATAEDWLSLPIFPTAAFLDAWAATTGVRLQIASNDAAPGTSVVPVPWGWSEPMRIRCQSAGWRMNVPSIEIVREANSRRWSVEQEAVLGVQLRASGAIASHDDFPKAVVKAAEIMNCPVDHVRWVIKSEFGMSARERIVGSGTMLPEPNQRWLDDRLAAGAWLVFEPWLDRLSESGILLRIEPGRVRVPQIVAITQLLTQPSGQYRGTRLNATNLKECDSQWQAALTVCRAMAQRLCDLGYFGPVGIDAMSYRLPDGRADVRPIQDVNARWTMGFVAVALAQKLATASHVSWLHLDTEALCRRLRIDPDARSEALLLERDGLNITAKSELRIPHVRAYLTSPIWLGDRPTRRTGVLLATDDRDALVEAEDDLTSDSRRF